MAPYGYSLFISRAIVFTIHGNFRISLNRISLKSIEINFEQTELLFSIIIDKLTGFYLEL